MAETATRPIYHQFNFIVFLTAAFINAFVDLGHKIIIQNTIFKIYDDAEQVIFTAVVNGLILLPFILVFTPSGYLSDRFSKPKIMQWSALAAVVITLLITLCYYQGWFLFAFGMTFLLALQSAFYSPAKYGYIREIAGEKRLAQANGFVQAITIVAILSSIVLFSIAFEHYLQNKTYQSEQEILCLIAPIGWILVSLSIIEFLLTFQIPNFNVKPSFTMFNWQHYRQGKLLKSNIIILSNKPIIWLSIFGLSLFWGISQSVLATFPAFAKMVLNEQNTIIIQGLLACSGIGIIVGSLLAGKLTNDSTANKLIVLGTLGLVFTLLLLPHLSSIVSFAYTITAFGLFGGLVIVPLNTLIQYHAPSAQLGTILAGNNWIQNIVMVSFLFFTLLAALFSISSKLILLLLPIITILLIINILYKIHKHKDKT